MELFNRDNVKLYFSYTPPLSINSNFSCASQVMHLNFDLKIDTSFKLSNITKTL